MLAVELVIGSFLVKKWQYGISYNINPHRVVNGPGDSWD